MNAELHSVLLVCTANMCRSPMAEGILRRMAGDSGAWRIESAGTWGFNGNPASTNAQRVLSMRGIDISLHRSRQITAEIMQDFTLILTMTRGHKEALQVEFPSIADRVYLLSEMIDAVFDIDDPIGGPLDEYLATASELEGIMKEGFVRIEYLSADSRRDSGG